MTEADYIVIGAGSAGCAIAYRLAEAGRKVLVIEHGGTDAGPFIKMPAALSYPMNMARYDWGYVTEPEPHMGGRRMACPRGKVIGGSSSINGMIYVRGHAHDYDTWAEMGADGWAYADVLPYFRRMEHWHGPEATPLARHRRAAAHHAWRAEKPSVPSLYRCRRCGGLRRDARLQRRTAGRLRRVRAHDLAGAALVGGGCLPAPGDGRRQLHRPARPRRPDRDHGGRASGVRLSDGRLLTARAEIILAAGAINSPKILMTSGIGPAKHLVENGIPVVADRPGVGQNLQDHLEMYIQFAAKQPVSLAPYWSLWGKALVGAQWVLSRTGLGASNQFEACGFIRSRAGIAYPDIQFHFLPIAVRYDGSTVAEGMASRPMWAPCARQPGARGAQRPDPATPPSILFNYMSHPQDWVDFRKAIRLTREIMAQPPMQPFAGAEILPGVDARDRRGLDDAIREHAESAYHPCGTCRMGRATIRAPWWTRRRG
jgi:choline dehydrogenase